MTAVRTRGSLAHRREIYRGVRESIPLGLALVPVGLAFGYAAHGAHLSWWLAGLMSAAVYGGPSQFLAAGLIAVGAATPTIVATTFVANLRYALFAASLAPHFRDAPPARMLPLAHGVADGSYALTLTHAVRHPGQPRKDLYLLGSFIVSFGAWVPSSAVGDVLGDALPPLLAYGLAFATPAIFIAFLIAALRNATSVLVMLIAGVGTVVGNVYLPTGTGPVLAILAASIIGGMLRWRRTPRSS